MRREVAAELRNVFDASARIEAERRLRQAVEKYARSAPKLSAWMDTNVAESFTVFAFPSAAPELPRCSRTSLPCCAS